MRRSILTSLERFRRAERGISSVEFVMCLPILIVMLVVVIDFGRLFIDYHAVSKSVRDATRYLSRVEAGVLGVNCPNTTVTESLNTTHRARRLVMFGAIKDDVKNKPLVKAWTATGLTEAATNIKIGVDCLKNENLTAFGDFAALQGLYVPGAWIPSIVVEANVPFNFKMATAIGFGSQINFRIEHKMPHFGCSGAALC